MPTCRSCLYLKRALENLMSVYKALRVCVEIAHPYEPREKPARTAFHLWKELERAKLTCINRTRMNISIRAVNGLRGAGIEYLEELVFLSERDLLRIHNFGQRSVNEVRLLLNSQGLSLRGETN